MAWRFRKSMSLGKGIRLNFGKKGIGMSVGVKGFRVGVGSKGAYTSTSIPGTGLYSVNYLKKNSQSLQSSSALNSSSSNNTLIWIFGIIGLILLFSAPALGFLFLVATGTTYYFWSQQPKQKAKKKFKQGRKFFNNQNFEEAIRLLKEAQLLDTENQNITYLLGGALHNAEKYEEALKYLQPYFINNPMDFKTQLLLAHCYYKTKNFDLAIKLLQTIPEDFEQSLKVIQMLGACFAEQKKYDLAISVFKKAPLQKRNLDEDLMEVHYNLGLIYEESGNKNNALKHFKKVYAENANYRNVTEKVENL